MMPREGLRLRVATLNVWGLPWDLARHTLPRMRAIREGLAALDADLVALQEVWSAEARQVLLEGAERAGWGWRWHNRADLGGSGLLVLSRLPIAEARFDPYRLRGRPERLRHGDYWGGKGFALLGIETPGGPVAVVDTHLHAQYGADAADEYLGERAGQVVELAAGLSGVAAPLVAAGDFNLREDQPLYRVLTGLAGLRDAAAERDARQPTVLGSNPYRSERPRGNARIDYLFVRDGALRGIRVRSVERIFDESLRLGGEPAAASDHAGLLAELEIGAPAGARRPSTPHSGVSRLCSRAGGSPSMPARRLAVLIALLAGCTWVPLTPEGEQVRSVTPEHAESCQRLGRTTSRVADRVWIFARNERAIREELASLARNEAALMGGDAVAPETRPEGGRQTFGVYRCRGA